MLLSTTSLYVFAYCLEKSYASPGLTTHSFYDARLSHNLQSYYGEGRATMTCYNSGVYQIFPILGGSSKKGKLHL